MSDFVADLVLAFLLGVGVLVWLVTRKTFKRFLKFWLLTRNGLGWVKKQRRHTPWATLPVFIWFIIGDLPAWVLLTRLVTAGTLVTFYKLWRKSRKANQGKQRKLAHVPIVKREDDAARQRPHTETGVQETNSLPESPPDGEVDPPETVEAEKVNDADSPQPVYSLRKLRRRREDELHGSERD